MVLGRMMRSGLLLILFWLSCVGSVGAVPSGRLAPAKGTLLVAAEDLPDPRFAKSVILLVEYGPAYVVGLIVNRPTRVTLEEAFAGRLEFGAGRHLFFGGPVSTGSVTCLLRATPAPPESSEILPGLHQVRIDQLAAELRREAGEERLRVFSGYAGWAPGQLAAEVARGDWYVLPGEAALLFDTPPEQLWNLLRQRGGEIWL